MTLDQRYWIWDVILLLSLAMALRAHNLGTLSFSESEVQTALIARSANEAGKLTRPISVIDSEHQTGDTLIPTDGPVYQASITFCFRWWGESEWIARLPAAFFGIVTTLWIYLWTSHWFGSWTARATGFLFAVMPWSVTWGRLANANSLNLFLYLLMVISTWKLLECNSLGHPIVVPAKVGGHKAVTVARVMRLFPPAIWGALGLLNQVSFFFSFLFFPVYLLTRLVWTLSRGRTEDFEFRRSWKYVVISLVHLSFFLVILMWFYGEQQFQLASGKLWISSGISQLPLMITFPPAFFPSLVWLESGEMSPLLFGLLLGLGSLMAVSHGRAGWLILASAGTPLLLHFLISPAFQEGILYLAFPFLLVLVCLPIGWSLEHLKDALNHWASPQKHWTWNLTGSLLILVLSLGEVVQPVFLDKHSTAAIVGGSLYLSGQEVTDWRGLSNLVPQLGQNDVVITTDPTLAVYYLGKADFIYPVGSLSRTVPYPRLGIPVLPDAMALANIRESADETWILGTRCKFEATQQSPEGNAIWSWLIQPPAKVWEGPLEVAIEWRNSIR